MEALSYKREGFFLSSKPGPILQPPLHGWLSIGAE